jgi:ribosomal protein S18 acetylase RimI-like enzyme
MKIRSAVPADVDELVRLLDEVDAFYGDEVTESAEHRASAVKRVLFQELPIARSLVAEADDRRLVGFASYSFLWPAAGSTASLYLKELFVSESYRSRGVGRLMFAELCRVAVASGLSRVELTTDKSNRDAQHFYSRLGLPVNDGKVFYRVEGDALKDLT